MKSLFLFLVLIFSILNPHLVNGQGAKIEEGSTPSVFGELRIYNIGSLAPEADTPPPVEGDPDTNLPIDGGLGFLLAAGLGYGANQIRKHKKNKKN